MVLLKSFRLLGRRPVITGLLFFAAVAVTLLVMIFTREPPERLLNRARRADGEERLRLLREAIEASGGAFPTAQLELCLALARDKKTDQLLAAIADLPLEKCDPQDLLSLATLTARAEHWAVAEDCLRAVAGRPHDTAARLSLQCELYEHSGRLRDLIDSAIELTVVAPDSPTGWWLLARASEKRQNNTEALAVYKKALAHALPSKDQLEMRYRILEHAIVIGDAETAEEMFETLVTLSRSDVRLDVYEARLLHLQGHPTEALRSISIAIQKIGKVPEALRLQGILYLELNELEKAITALKDAAARNSQDEVIFFKLAEAYRRLAARDKDPEHFSTAEFFLSQYRQLHAENLRRLGLQ